MGIKYLLISYIMFFVWNFSEIYSNLATENTPIVIEPATAHDLWDALRYGLNENVRFRTIYIKDIANIVDSESGHWMGTVTHYMGNLSGILINLWTRHATIITMADYVEDKITFTRLPSNS